MLVISRHKQFSSHAMCTERHTSMLPIGVYGHKQKYRCTFTLRNFLLEECTFNKQQSSVAHNLSVYDPRWLDYCLPDLQQWTRYSAAQFLLHRRLPIFTQTVHGMVFFKLDLNLTKPIGLLTVVCSFPNPFHAVRYSSAGWCLLFTLELFKIWCAQFTVHDAHETMQSICQ